MDVSVFISYAHVDNDAMYGRIKEISKGTGQTYSALTGKSVKVFVDTDSIALGEEWRERIRSGLSSATILLAFISPAYMHSTACRGELRDFLSFLSQGGSSRLIIPLLLVERSRMDELFPDDDLWDSIVSLQYLSIDDMRFEDPGTGAWLAKIHKIAERVNEKLSEQAQKGSAITPDIPDGSVSDVGDPVGKYELIARLELEGPNLSTQVQKFGSLVEQFATIVNTATPEMTAAGSFSQRLIVSRELAEKLGPVTEQSLATSEVMIKSITSMDPGVVAAIRLAKVASDRKTPEVQAFIESIRFMANGIVEATSHLMTFEASIEEAKGYSSDLDKPLDTMQRSLLLVAEMNAIAERWLDELGDVESPVE
jgi:hypothetical protein